MKIMRLTSAFVVFMIMLLPPLSWGQDKKDYVLLRGGTYTFMDSLKQGNIATGFDGELAVGRYLFPNLALEAATGYFHDGVNKGYGNDVRGIPVKLTAKGIYPLTNFDLFAGAGVGVYFARFHGQVNGRLIDRSKATFGSHAVIGAYYNFSRSFFAGIEWKYIVTEKTNFDFLRTSLNGFTATADFGYRF